MTPRTQAGRDLLAPYAGLSDEQVRAIEDEVLDRVRAAVEGLYPEQSAGSVVTNQSRVHRRAVLAAIERVRSDR